MPQLYDAIGAPEEALQARLSATRLFPEDFESWLDLGLAYGRMSGHSQDSIDAYLKVVELRPTFSFGWDRLGDAYMGVGRADDALHAYTTTLELGYGHPSWTWSKLGRIHLQAGRHELALEAGRRAVTAIAVDAQAWSFLGKVQLAMGSRQDTLESFCKALQLETHNPDTIARVAYFLNAMGETGKARSALERAVSVWEAYPRRDEEQLAHMLANLGVLLVNLDDVEPARHALERALVVTETAQAEPGDLVARVHFAIGVVLTRMGKPKAARPHLERALALHEASPTTDDERLAQEHEALARVLEDLDELEGAKARWARALEINQALPEPYVPAVALAWLHVGRLQSRLGELGEATPTLQAALDFAVSSDLPGAHTALCEYVLGVALRRQGDLVAARAHLERALALDLALFGVSHERVTDRVETLREVLTELG